jgi:tRNA(fMet)-specific endonuclease VapC
VYLLDTNHCSFLLNGEPSVVKKLNGLGNTKLATCVIVQGELIYMVYKSAKLAENLKNINEFLNEIDILGIDKKTANIYGKIKADLFKKFGPKRKRLFKKTTLHKLGFQENDLWIASVAIKNNLTIVTKDKDFSRINEITPLSLDNWHSS